MTCVARGTGLSGRDAKPSSRNLRYSGCTYGAADLDGNRRRSRFAITRVSRTRNRPAEVCGEASVYLAGLVLAAVRGRGDAASPRRDSRTGTSCATLWRNRSAFESPWPVAIACFTPTRLTRAANPERRRARDAGRCCRRELRRDSGVAVTAGSWA